MSKPLLTFAVLGLCSIWLVGCGGGGVEPAEAEDVVRGQLKEVYNLVVVYTKKHQQQSPKSLADLQQYQLICPVGLRALKENAVVLKYGSLDVVATTVMAYEKDADTEGGLVLMGDGNVRKMSADEARAAIAKGKR